MKKAISFMGPLILALTIGACSNEDESPTINPILGQWVAAEDQFLTILVDGHEKSTLEFGMEVLGYNEASAEIKASEYLKYNVLGPIDILMPKLKFSSSEQLSATLSGEEIDGTWKFQNDRTFLNLWAPVLDATSYNFKINRLTSQELELGSNLEVSRLGENQAYQIDVKVKLIK